MSENTTYPEKVIPALELASPEQKFSVLANDCGEFQVEIEIDHKPDSPSELAEIKSFIGINAIEGTADVLLTVLSGDDSIHLELNRNDGDRLNAALDLYKKWARTERRNRGIEADQETDCD